MKLGLSVFWKDVRNRMGSGLEFLRWGETRMNYTIPLKLKLGGYQIKVPNQTFTKPEVKGDGCKWGLEV